MVHLSGWGAQKVRTIAPHFKPADWQASLAVDHGSTSREQKVHGREQGHFTPTMLLLEVSLIMRLLEVPRPRFVPCDRLP